MIDLMQFSGAYQAQVFEASEGGMQPVQVHHHQGQRMCEAASDMGPRGHVPIDAHVQVCRTVCAIERPAWLVKAPWS